MNRISWILRMRLMALDHLQLTLGALLVASLLLIEVGLKPRIEASRAVQHDLRLLAASQQQPLHLVGSKSPTSVTPVQPTAPAITELPETLEQLNELFRHNGIDMLSPHYSLTKEKGYYRYQLVVETESPYRKVRKLIQDMPRALPASSLDSLQMQLVDDKNGTLSTELHLSFYFRQSPDSHPVSRSSKTR